MAIAIILTIVLTLFIFFILNDKRIRALLKNLFKRKKKEFNMPSYGDVDKIPNSDSLEYEGSEKPIVLEEKNEEAIVAVEENIEKDEPNLTNNLEAILNNPKSDKRDISKNNLRGRTTFDRFDDVYNIDNFFSEESNISDKIMNLPDDIKTLILSDILKKHFDNSIKN